MPRTRFVSALVVATITGLTPLHAELRLACEVDGHALPVAAIVDGKIWLQDGDKRIAAPDHPEWRLEGDARAAVHSFRWSPIYSILRESGPDWQQAGSPRFLAHVSVSHRFVIDSASKPTKSPFLRDWPEGNSQNGLIVVGWLIDGNFLLTKAQPAPRTDKENLRSLDFTFNLTTDQAAKGHPGVALWRDGEFVPPSPDFSTPADQEALAAVVFNDAPALRAALAAGAQANARGQRGSSLIHIAAESGAADAIDVLLAADPKQKNAKLERGQTPLHWASTNGRTDAVRRLLAAQANKNAKDTGDNTPLLLASVGGHRDVARLLLDAHASVLGQSKSHLAPIPVAINRGDFELTEMLFKAGAGFEANKDSPQVLLTQVRYGHTAIVKWLADHGVSPGAKARGENALHVGSYSGDPALAEFLISAKVPLDEGDPNGRTPLMVAGRRGQHDYAERLIDAGAKVNQPDAKGFTPLHHAALNDQGAVARLLLERQADPTLRSKGGIDVLELALFAESKDVVRELIARGGQIDLRQPHALKSLEAAIRIDAVELIDRALVQGWSAETRFADDWPAIRVAEVFRAEKVSARLQAAGAVADPNLPTPIVLGSQLDAPPRLTTVVPPDDPREADDSYPSQTVSVEILTSAAGRVQFSRVVESPDARLRAAVVAVLGQWQFAPLTSLGQPVATRAVIPVRFPGSDDRSFDPAEVDELPQAITRVPPKYPQSELKLGIDARVILEFVINREGVAEAIRVRETTGEAFSREATAALQKWRYKPAMLDGKPVPVRMSQPVIFSIR